jgi:hypothetical protein
MGMSERLVCALGKILNRIFSTHRAIGPIFCVIPTLFADFIRGVPEVTKLWVTIFEDSSFK